MIALQTTGYTDAKKYGNHVQTLITQMLKDKNIKNIQLRLTGLLNKKKTWYKYLFLFCMKILEET